jgi:hypothetical protein
MYMDFEVFHFSEKITFFAFYLVLLPRSHINGSPRQFYDGLNLTDDPGYANFLCTIRMRYDATTVLYVSTKDNAGKGQFYDRNDTDCDG